MSGDALTFQSGEILDGRYRIESRGQAQVPGTVFVASDLMEGRPVHLLVLDLQPGTGAGLAAHLRRAQREIAALGQSSLVPYYGAGLLPTGGSAPSLVYMVRLLTGGQTLAFRLARVGPLPAETAARLALRLCETLVPLHSARLVHGSLTPTAVLLDRDDRVRVTDAALFPALRSHSAVSGQPWGCFPYASLEQAAGKPATPASDVYLVGLLLYDMVAGRSPFTAQDGGPALFQNSQQVLAPLRSLAPQVPATLAQIVHQALATEPSARYRNADQMAHILRAYLRAPLSPDHGVPRRENGRRTEPISPVPTPLDPARDAAPGAPEVTVSQSRQQPDYVEPFYLDSSEPESEDGLDPLLVALLLIAVAAIIGLGPLWWAVYNAWRPF